MLLSLAPSAPLEVNATTTSSMTIEVRWVEPAMPNGIVRTYRVTYSSSGFTNAVNVSETMVTLDGLRPFTNYSISVDGFTVAFGTRSQIAIATTFEAGEWGSCNAMAYSLQLV